MMQATWLIQLLGWTLLVLGVIFVIIALVQASQRSGPDDLKKTGSRGVILIGPIPIVWGYGRRGCLIAGTIGMLLLLFWLLLFL